MRRPPTPTCTDPLFPDPTLFRSELPPALVFQAAFEVLGTYGKNAAGLADRARTLYPGWGRAHAIHAAHQRVNGTLDPSVLEPLMRTLSTTQHADAYAEGRSEERRLGKACVSTGRSRGSADQ